MDQSRWKKIDELLQRTLDLPTAERASFLDRSCQGDKALRAELDSFLAADQQMGAFLDQPLFNRETDQFAVGSQIGAYRIESLIGRGGMGAVYLAKRADNLEFDQQAAIKLIKRGMDTDEIIKRFRYERRILASLDHPNIARLLDGGTTEDGLPYFVMEHIEGIPLLDYCQKKNPTLVEKLRLFLQICSAVQHAHDNFVVHRDLKPSNILITKNDSVKLLDFGIAKLLNAEEKGLSTLLGQRPMTPEYASPEQIRGEAITTASDVYSLGIVLYELLTGQRPYQLQQRNTEEISNFLRQYESQLPSQTLTNDKQRRELQGDLDNIVMMAIRKEPESRYRSVAQLAEDIERHLSGQTVIARPKTFSYRAVKFIKRHRAGVSASMAFAILLIGSIVALAVQSSRLASERDRAIAAVNFAAEQRDQALLARDAEKEQRRLAETNERRAAKAETQAVTAARKAIIETHRAREAAYQVEIEAQRARIEAETTQQVSQFLEGMFNSSDPVESSGRPVTARDLLDKGATKVRNELGNAPIIQAKLMETIGNAYQSLGLYQNATPLLEKSLQIRTEKFGNEHAEVAQALASKAILQINKGDFRAAEPLLKEALNIRRKLFGSEHRLVADSLSNLALVYENSGNYDDAEKFYTQALTTYRKVFGNEHRLIATSLNNLAVLLRRKKDYDSSELLYREALTMRRKLLGDGHPEVATTLNNLAVLLEIKRDYASAEPFCREALEIRRKVYGNEHPQIANSLHNLAALLRNLRKDKEAELLFREAIAMRRKLLGEEHPHLLLSQHLLARLLSDRKDYLAAEPLFRESLAIRRKTLGSDHPDLANSLVELGKLLIQTKDYENAEPLLREGLQIRKRKLSSGDWQTADAECLLGICLALAKRYEEAEPLLRFSYLILKEKRNDRSNQVNFALQQLVLIYLAWGKAEKAAEYQALLPK